MSTRPIDQPLPGERVVALSPEHANAAATDWRRRPNLFAGRALTAPTLEQRQRWQAGRIALRAQAFTPGVAQGLDVTWTVEAAGDGAVVARLQVAPGRALTVRGEDVVLAAPVDVRVGDLPVVAEPAVFDADAPTDPVPGGLGVLRPRVVGPTRLGALTAGRPDLLPSVGVLVLQPVVTDRSDADPTDPCDRCGCGDASDLSPDSVEDWRIADGVRLLWYAWPDEWRALPPDTVRRRNALAHLVFDAEAALGDGEALPWEIWGAPIAIVGVNAAWEPVMVDRATVVRHGGRARYPRLTLGADGRIAVGDRRQGLWQARIEQLAEQLAEQTMTTSDPAALREAFGRLPPAGLLPPQALNLEVLPLNLASETLQSRFFPPGFELDAVPVPIEQLDVAVREAAALAPIDFSSAERVRVLVPVTQASFEPRLLFEETVAPEFQETVDRFALVRARTLGARQGLRHAVGALTKAVQGTAATVPAIEADPLALEPEDLTPWGPPPSGGGHRTPIGTGLHQHFFLDAATSIRPRAEEALYVWVYLDPDVPPQTLMFQWHAAGSWEHRVYWGDTLIALGEEATASRRRVDAALPPAGRWVRLAIDPGSIGLAGAAVDGVSFTLFGGRAAFGPTGVASSGGDRAWFGGTLPTGAVTGGTHAWESLTDNDLWAPFEAPLGLTPPTPAGVPAGGGHVEPAGTGLRQHFFVNATARLAIAAGQRLFAWVWLDPENPPRSLMLQWNVDGNWEHRAYLGENLIGFGADGTPSRRPLGALPALGSWVRLTVSAADVALEGMNLAGMAFAVFDGRAAFGAAGRLQADGSETVWFSGALPAGAAPTGIWSFLTPEQMPAPFGAPATGVAAAVAALRADPALAPLSARERAQLDVRGVEGFVAYLKARADRADDLVDYGFIKVQTDVYRVRQLVLGTTAATRLAVSPALATIAQAETAVASQEQISTFYGTLTSSAALSAAPRSGGSAPAAGGVPAAFEAGAVIRAASASLAAAEASAPAVASRAAGGAATFGATRVLAQPSPAIGTAARMQEPAAPGALRIVDDTSAIIRERTGDIGVIGIATGLGANTPGAVINASPIVGKATIRTTAIAQRLEDPKAIEAKDYTAATRHDAVSALVQFAEQLRAEDAGVTPGLFDGIDVYGVRDDAFLGAGNTSRRVPLAQFILDRSRVAQLLATPLRTRPVPGANETVPDEGAYFSDSVDLSDNTVALVRQLEGRIKLYRDAIAAADRARVLLQEGLTRGAARLAAIGDALAEARHDVSVARALLAEEADRVAGINARRAAVLAQEVRFLAFVRPRETDNLAEVPRRQLDPGLVDAPAPACLDEHPDVPDELVGMLRVVREAPARWFADVPALVDRLDRPDLLVRVLQGAQTRTQLAAAVTRPAVATPVPHANRLIGAMSSITLRQQAVVSQDRAVATTLDLGRIQGLTWQGMRNQATQVVSLGDLIDGEHGRHEVSRRAAQAFEDIGRITSCLHAAFSAVLPSIRLDWAETLSQFDASPSLRRLGALARWGEIPYVERHRMQALADWLFSRVNALEPRAESLMNDVVRMCLLLASHAPVGRIVAGRLPRPITVRPGIRLPLTAFEPGRLRVGMEALVYRGAAVVARAVVEDVGANEIATRVVQTSEPQLDLDVTARVQFSEAAAVSLAAASRPAVGRR